jgi:hypothetical protein
VPIAAVIGKIVWIKIHILWKDDISPAVAIDDGRIVKRLFRAPKIQGIISKFQPFCTIKVITAEPGIEASQAEATGQTSEGLWGEEIDMERGAEMATAISVEVIIPAIDIGGGDDDKTAGPSEGNEVLQEIGWIGNVFDDFDGGYKVKCVGGRGGARPIGFHSKIKMPSGEFNFGQVVFDAETEIFFRGEGCQQGSRAATDVKDAAGGAEGLEVPGHSGEIFSQGSTPETETFDHGLLGETEDVLGIGGVVEYSCAFAVETGVNGDKSAMSALDIVKAVEDVKGFPGGVEADGAGG